VREIPGIRLHTRAQTFAWGDELYQLIDLDPELKHIEDAKDALDITQLYACSDHVRMLGPRLTIDDLVRTHHVNYHLPGRDGHPRARDISLEPFVELFHASTRDLRPADEARFRSGLFHEDLQTGNLLSGGGRLHVIDLDPIWHTYSVMNLAHFTAIEVVANRRHDLFDAVRDRFLAALVEESPRDFDYFVLLALYRALVRRAFHRDVFAASALEDFAWYFRQLGLDFYLARATGRS
jgi:hypothetical protein